MWKRGCDAEDDIGDSGGRRKSVKAREKYEREENREYMSDLKGERKRN